jgi:hypothetical protein
MLKTKKNLLSFFPLCVFACFAIASKVNHIYLNSFKYDNPVEDKSEEGNYLVKNNGDKVYGEKIVTKSGILTKNEIKISDQKFKISEIRGYRYGSKYYGRVGTDYLLRIVHGKLNVYVQFTEVTSTSTTHDGIEHQRSYTRTDHYSQRGEDGPIIPMASQKDIKNLVSDCPLAVQLVDLSDSKISKAIKKDPNYLNNIFDL